MAEKPSALPINAKKKLRIDGQTEGIECPRLDVADADKYEPIIVTATRKTLSGLQILTGTPCKHSRIDSEGGYDKFLCNPKPEGGRCTVQDGSLVAATGDGDPHVVTGKRRGLAVTVDLRP
jgi:hypothetical protein